MLVGVEQELVEQAIGPVQFEDVLGCQEWGQTFLPVVVTAFDFAFGLRSGRVVQGDSVEVQSRSQLGQSLRRVGEEKGVIVDIEGQGQALSQKSAGQKVEVSEQSFAVVEASTGIVAGGVIQEVVQGLFIGIVRQPGMGAGIGTATARPGRGPASV